MKSNRTRLLVVSLTVLPGMAWAEPATLAEDFQTLRTAENGVPSAEAAPASVAQPAAQMATSNANPVPPLVPPPPATDVLTTTAVDAPEPLAAAPQAAASQAPAPKEMSSAETPPASAGSEGMTIPGASLSAAPSKAERPLLLGTSDPLNPWQAATLVTVALAGLGMFGWSLVRFRKRGTHAPLKNEKPMQVVSTLPLSPKRQLIMVRIRDQEIVLASTEQGITLLTELNEKPAARPLVETRPLPPLPRPAEVTQETREALARAAAPREIPPAPEERKPATKKSDLLSKALNTIKEKKPEPAPTPTLPQTRGNFNKYVANVFDQEAKRNLQEKGDDGNEDTVESVTKMIRERLKNIQPHSEGGS